jgi:hypothetical protein
MLVYFPISCIAGNVYNSSLLWTSLILSVLFKKWACFLNNMQKFIHQSNHLQVKAFITHTNNVHFKWEIDAAVQVAHYTCIVPRIRHHWVFQYQRPVFITDFAELAIKSCSILCPRNVGFWVACKRIKVSSKSVAKFCTLYSITHNQQ